MRTLSLIVNNIIVQFYLIISFDYVLTIITLIYNSILMSFKMKISGEFSSFFFSKS